MERENKKKSVLQKKIQTLLLIKLSGFEKKEKD